MKLKTFNLICTVVFVIFAAAIGIWVYGLFAPVDYMLESIAQVVSSFLAVILIILASFKNRWVKQDSDK